MWALSSGSSNSSGSTSIILFMTSTASGSFRFLILTSIRDLRASKSPGCEATCSSNHFSLSSSETASSAAAVSGEDSTVGAGAAIAKNGLYPRLEKKRAAAATATRRGSLREEKRAKGVLVLGVLAVEEKERESEEEEARTSNDNEEGRGRYNRVLKDIEEIGVP
uniref:Uncharacterized protein n=1 Tax=Opuntia streptacantha TaxID=393608 RepID=A0A7C9DZX8_OPUST